MASHPSIPDAEAKTHQRDCEEMRVLPHPLVRSCPEILGLTCAWMLLFLRRPGQNPPEILLQDCGEMFPLPQTLQQECVGVPLLL